MKTSANLFTATIATLMLASCAKDEATVLIHAQTSVSAINAQGLACDRQAALLLNTKWNLESLNGVQPRPNPDIGTPWVKLTGENGGRLIGFGGCNALRGAFQISCGSLSIIDLGSTLIYCEHANNMEQTFLTALRDTKTFSITGSSLTLFNGSVEVATLVADRSSQALPAADL